MNFRTPSLFAPFLLAGCLLTMPQAPPSSGSLRAETPGRLFDLLEEAYRTRSIALFSSLLAEDYVFDADESSLVDRLRSQWGRDEEIARHRRMFQAISNVTMNVSWDSMSVVAHPDVPESTWTAWQVEMTMDLGGTGWSVSGQADFRLRRLETGNGPRYVIVRWSDRN